MHRDINIVTNKMLRTHILGVQGHNLNPVKSHEGKTIKTP